MVAWPTVPIGELFRLKQGTYLKPEEMKEEQTAAFPFPVYGANGVIGYSNRKMYSERTTLVSCRGANCGVVHFTVPNIWISNNSIACVPTAEVDPTFYYYVCRNTNFGDVITGSAQPQITITNLSSKQFIKPPLPVQRRIAEILAAYDELIENSQRRYRILEKMSRSLYSEWFVQFRFPGHEKVKMEGGIPKGWEKKRLSAVAEVNRAQINARNAPDEVHYIDISSVSPGQIDALTTYAFVDAPGRARRIVEHGNVLWSCVRPNRRSYAQVMYPQPNTIASTGFAVLTATEVPFTFLYYATTTDDFVAYLTNNATGAAYPAVSATTFEKAVLLIPPVPLLKKFGDATIPIAEQAYTLHRQIQTLRRTRDLLLPRLLSGQVNLGDN